MCGVYIYQRVCDDNSWDIFSKCTVTQYEIVFTKCVMINWGLCGMYKRCYKGMARQELVGLEDGVT